MITANILLYILLFLSLYFEVFLLITFFDYSTNKKNTATSSFTIANADLPSTTIVVPCHNEENTVAATINSLLSLNYPRDKLNIIVVDDGSTDSTLATVLSFENNPQVKILNKSQGGKHTAMNLALSYTHTELIGCLDADSFVEKDALRHLVEHFKNPTISAVTPSIKVRDAHSFIERIQASEYILSILLRKMLAQLHAIFITPGPFSIFRTTAIQHVGEWKNAHNTEDLEMGLRLQNNFMKIENEPRAEVYTVAPTTFTALYKQRVRWSYGFLRNAFDYRHMIGNITYGHLGVFILPFSIISIIGAVLLLFILVMNVLQFMGSHISQAITFGYQTPNIVFDPFYIESSAMLFITIAIVLITLALVLLGKYLSNEKQRLHLDIFLYLAFYGFLAPLWLTGATARAAIRKNIHWK